MYEVYRERANGEIVHLDCCVSLEQAARLVERLNAVWPGKYLVRDPEGNDVGVI